MRRVFLLVALVALAGCGSAHAARRTSSGQADVPGGFAAETAAAVGTRDLWVLGDYKCGAGAYCLALIRSHDGGEHFARVAAPPLASQGTVSIVVFADGRDGYAYTSTASPLYVTHDGGVTWHRELTGSAIAIAVGDRTVYAVMGRCSRARGCVNFRLARSSVSRSDWRSLTLPAGSGVPFSLAARGDDLWLLGRTNSATHQFDRLARSTNGGRSFTVRSGPCFADLGGRLAPAANGTVWAVCPSGMMAGLWLSRDGGRSFPSVRSFHDPGSRHQPLLTNAAAIAPISSRAAVLYGGVQGPLWRTSDAGLHWSRLAETARFGQVQWLAFATHHVGAAVVQIRGVGTRSELWRTTNGGTTWRNVPLP